MSIHTYTVHEDIELLLAELASEDGLNAIDWVNRELSSVRQTLQQSLLAFPSAEEIRIISAPKAKYIECALDQLNVGTIARLMVLFDINAESVITLLIYRADTSRHGTAGQRHRCANARCRV